MNPRDPVRERLLSVSCELFARQGYDGTSVRDITRRARANLGAITYHFGSKEALYHEVLASRVEPLVELVARAAALPGTPLDRVEAIVRTFLDFVAAHPEMPKLILRELAAERPLPPPAQRAMQRNFGALVEAVAAGQRDGTIRSGEPTLLAFSAMAQPFFFAIGARMILSASGLDLKDPTTRTPVAGHLVTTIRRALAANPTINA
ncbi:MAG: TetR/AcrR family transcriptional regulator [Gemmatimonadetes bacterium]|nr:TetR/AcrR family transcriptional regulator [Gemmatimonadota bacterium]MBI2614350.1 TetR/AcrR family transcriptional regulator [Gemmatimonadota bacterium]